MKDCLGLFAVHVRHGQAERLVVRRWAAHRVNACDRAVAVDRHSGNLLCSKVHSVHTAISIAYVAKFCGTRIVARNTAITQRVFDGRTQIMTILIISTYATAILSTL